MNTREGYAGSLQEYIDQCQAEQPPLQRIENATDYVFCPVCWELEECECDTEKENE